MSDPALTAELLVLANSAAYGGRSKVETIGVGIRYLGLERVRAIAATSALRSHTRSSQPDPYLGSVWAHSVATAVAAEALGNACGRRGLYTLGLSKEFQNIEQANRMERNLYGMTHCQAGALVAASWGLPESLAACMGEHHVMPAGSGPRGLIVIAGFAGIPRGAAVRAAWLARAGPGPGTLCPSRTRSPLGRHYAAHHGSQRLSGLRCGMGEAVRGRRDGHAAGRGVVFEEALGTAPTRKPNRTSHSTPADVARALVPTPVPAVSRLVSTLFPDVTPCRTKSVPMSGDVAGMSAQCHLVFVRTGIRQKLWGRLATCGGLLTRRKPL